MPNWVSKLPLLVVQAQFVMEILSIELSSYSEDTVGRGLILSVTYTLGIFAT